MDLSRPEPQRTSGFPNTEQTPHGHPMASGAFKNKLTCRPWFCWAQQCSNGGGVGRERTPIFMEKIFHHRRATIGKALPHIPHLTSWAGSYYVIVLLLKILRASQFGSDPEAQNLPEYFSCWEIHSGRQRRGTLRHPSSPVFTCCSRLLPPRGLKRNSSDPLGLPHPVCGAWTNFRCS